MSYVKVSEILTQVDKENTSVIGFNCTNYDMASAAVVAAEELKKPVVLMLYLGHTVDDNLINLSGFTAMVKELGEKASIPVAVHLDHCSDMNYIPIAIEHGFTSVMYDGSHLPFEENLENTKKMVDLASKYNADVEGELGAIGTTADGNHLNTSRYTDPEEAALFARETGVTSLAIDIGSAHGVYKEEPKLDINRLAEINSATDVPLVLHGGSGIPDDQLEEAFKNGINKFNFSTYYFMEQYHAILEYCEKYGKDVPDYFPPGKYIQERLIPVAKDRLRLTLGTY